MVHEPLELLEILTTLAGHHHLRITKFSGYCKNRRASVFMVINYSLHWASECSHIFLYGHHCSLLRCIIRHMSMKQRKLCKYIIDTGKLPHSCNLIVDMYGLLVRCAMHKRFHCFCVQCIVRT